MTKLELIYTISGLFYGGIIGHFITRWWYRKYDKAKVSFNIDKAYTSGSKPMFEVSGRCDLVVVANEITIDK